MESALHGIFALGEVSEISLVRCAHSGVRFRIRHAPAFHEVISILSRISLIEIHTDMDICEKF